MDQSVTLRKRVYNFVIDLSYNVALSSFSLDIKSNNKCDLTECG